MPIDGFRPDINKPGAVGQETEYGGNAPDASGRRGTSPQRMPDDSSKKLSVGESARVLRETGILGGTLPEAVDAATAMAGLEPGTLEYAQEVERQQARIDLERKTNGYWKELDTDENLG
jgi:hypothetical protein